MRFAYLYFCIVTAPASAQKLPDQPGVHLKASLAGSSLILNDVFLNGVGPFRMLLDTGNTASIVRPGVARRLNIKPAYTVEQASVVRTRRVPAAILDEVCTGSVSDRFVEAMIGEVFQADVDGILGESWLARHDYLLDYRNQRVILDGVRGGSGVRVPLQSAEGRPVVVALIDGRSRKLVVDSGASAVVLFEKPVTRGVAVQLNANGGSVLAQKFTARFSFTGENEHVIDAVRVDASGLGPGMLPASAFASVFVSNRDRFVEFTQ
jgi:predicted aspartyl protease